MLARAQGDERSLPRIAILAAGELFGGVERHVLDSSVALATRGVSVRLLLFHDAELAARAREQGITPTILPAGKRAVLGSALTLARLLREERTALVHAHGYKAIVACALARAFARLVVVKTEHGLPEAVTGRSLRAHRNRFYALLDTIATRCSGANVCYVTRELQEQFRTRHAGLDTRVVPNGVARLEPEHHPLPVELRTAGFKLALVGRLEPVKGHTVAIEALAAPGAAPDIQLYVLGDGPRGNALRELASARGLADRVHFLGFRRDVLSFIAHCDALLMPSLHEGLPYALLEAMALGTPVIASKVGGIAEVTEHGVTALRVPPGDALALASAIATLRADPALRRRLSARARALQQTSFSLDAMVARYLDLYLELSREAPASAARRAEP